MRIAIGEFAHETNTFCPGVTPLAQFQARHWASGDEIFAIHRGVRDSLGGMIAAAEADGITVVPIFATSTEPSATIAQDAYDTIRDHLITGINNANEIDALVLALHAAGVTEGSDDLEGTLLAEIRAAVGPELPIVVTLDLHGHTTRAMVDNATALLYCHEYPHVDAYERGEEAMRLAAAIGRGESRPVMRLETRPMLIPPATTRHGAAKRMNELCFAWEARPGVIDAAFVHGFPHTDVSTVNAAILVTTEGDTGLAEEAATDLAGQLWAMRDEFIQNLPDAAAAVAQALASAARPVVIAEVSDNPGGGAPGDGTHLLRALLAANERETCFGFIADPETARQAHEAGTGATIRARLGGKTDDLHGAPIEADAYVKCLTDGRFYYTTPMGAGRLGNLGPMARLVIGNVDVLVSSVRTQTLDSEVFLLHGIDVTRYRIIALKSHQHFLAGFQHLAGEIIRADTPGLTTSNLHHLPYRRVPRPIWPLDAIDEPGAGPSA